MRLLSDPHVRMPSLTNYFCPSNLQNKVVLSIFSFVFISPICLLLPCSS